MEGVLNRTITISSSERKSTKVGEKISIKDERGLKYNFFVTKQDGSASKAYETFSNFKIGDRADVSYKEEQLEYEGKPYTSRTVLFFRPPSVLSQDSGNVGGNIGSTDNRTSDIHRQVAFKAVIDLIAAGKLELVDYKLKTMEFYNFLESPLTGPQVKNASVDDEDVTVEDIPF